MYLKYRNAELNYLKIFSSKKFYIISILFIFIFIINSIFAIQIYRAGYLYYIRDELGAFLTRGVYNKINSSFVKAEKVSINIDFESLEKLNTWKQQALKRFTLRAVNHEYVNANIVFNNKNYPIKIRLKGSTAREHFGSSKWSFRIKVLGTETILGMKEFSIMAPKRRNFLFEWFLRVLLKEEGLLSKKYGFLEVDINGDRKGIFSYDEHISKILLERNNRKEGPIIRLNSNSLWDEKAAYTLPPSQWGDYYYSANISALGMTKLKNNSVLMDQYKRASYLFDGFRSGNLMASEVFEVQQLAKYMALSAVSAGWHGALIFNSNFYFNPITSLLEPVPDDSYTEFSISWGLKDKYILDEFTKQLLMDNNFAKLYLTELNKVSKSHYLKNVINKVSSEIKRLERIIHKDYPLYYFPKNKLYENQFTIRETLNAKNVVVGNLETNPVDLSNDVLNFKSSNNSLSKLDLELRPKLKVSLTNLKSILPIEIINLTNNNIVFQPSKNQNLIIGGGNRPFLKPVNYESKEFNIPMEFIFSSEFSSFYWMENLYVNYKVVGSDRIRRKPIINNPSYKASISENYRKQNKKTIFEFPFIDVNEKFNTIKIQSGEWKLDRNLIIPENYTLFINEGTKIDLINSSSIISKSNIIASGSRESPIIISSSDKSGQGIFISESKKKSILNFVNFVNLNSINNEKTPIQLTGAVTFYKTAVDISNSRFIKSLSEDALNIIRSEFRLTDIFVDSSYSDSIDIDFSNGDISNVSIINSGNDGLDFSGSSSHIENFYANSIGDKGLSVGEDSDIKLSNGRINNCNYGVVSKDLSNLEIVNLNLNNCKIGLAAYQKKPEYGPGTISATKVKLNNVNKISFVDINSNIFYDTILSETDNSDLQVN